ncbi:uncharacterized protein LOC5575557 [Aedes aegypti]|uniref:Uncharacterized protein n=3 Tax=Aedes aegypti TaxID=7159 RepID=A0A903TU11_AEDAE|nr:uncharacterized protein LOC5575557 [Aedes aegypti]
MITSHISSQRDTHWLRTMLQTIITLTVILLPFSSSHNIPPWNGCYAVGCSTQQGCTPWNFYRYPCYRTCYYNRYCPPPSPPSKKCYKITHVATGKSMTSSEVFNATTKAKYATVSSNPPANFLWTMEPSYGGVNYIQNANTLEFLKADSNGTRLALNETLDRSFQFRPIQTKEGASKLQLQSVFNNGFLFVQTLGQGGSTVQITTDPFTNYYQTIWCITELYC